jgi:hypothetical protein
VTVCERLADFLRTRCGLDKQGGPSRSFHSDQDLDRITSLEKEKRSCPPFCHAGVVMVLMPSPPDVPGRP